MKKDDYIVASRLGLATAQGAVFSEVTYAVQQGQLGVIHGPSGTGRSALLLALTGRMAGLTGELRVAEFNAIRRARQIRQISSLARISDLVTLEGQLTVAECLTERSLIDGIKPERGERAFEQAEMILEHQFNRDALVDHLGALDRTLLALALASLRPAHIIALDDAEHRLDLDQQRILMAALERLTATGVTVLVSTTESLSIPASAAVLALGPEVHSSALSGVDPHERT